MIITCQNSYLVCLKSALIQNASDCLSYASLALLKLTRMVPGTICINYLCIEYNYNLDKIKKEILNREGSFSLTKNEKELRYKIVENMVNKFLWDWYIL